MKYFKDEEGKLYRDPILENHKDKIMIALTTEKFNTLVLIKNPIVLLSVKSKNKFIENRSTILNSIDWLGARITREDKLVSQNITPPDKTTWTLEQSNQYYIYCQSLSDRPSTVTDWELVTYPTVPIHVYEDMADNIKLLCQELRCSPE